MMPELDREAILSQRLEEKQRVLDKVNISMMLKTHRKQADSPEGDMVSSAAKRMFSNFLLGSLSINVGVVCYLR